jgi:hypothetical protein
MSSKWEAISAISSLIQAIVIIITVIFAVLQIRQTNRSHKLDVFIRLFDELSSPSSRKNRVFIYSLQGREPSQLATEEFLTIDEVLSSLDRIWILIQHGQLDNEFVYETYGEMFLKLWGVLQPIVIHERGHRGNYYRQRTESLVKSVRKYFKTQNKPLEYPIY